MRALRTKINSPLYDRAVIAGRLPRLAVRHDPTSRALARALRSIALQRLRPDEREWVRRVEARRRELAADTRELRPDFEAEPGMAPGDFLDNGERPPIAGIAVLLSISQWWGQLLMRLVRELAPKRCLELGTAVGISTAYQAAALELNGSGRLTTLEGARTWASVAEEGLSLLGLGDRARVKTGAIDATLAEALREIGSVDYAYLDADHSQGATMRHFDTILPHVAPGGVVVLDDIGYSPDMWSAWHAVQSRPQVSTSLALGRMGLVTVA